MKNQEKKLFLWKRMSRLWLISTMISFCAAMGFAVDLFDFTTDQALGEADVRPDGTPIQNFNYDHIDVPANGVVANPNPLPLPLPPGEAEYHTDNNIESVAIPDQNNPDNIFDNWDAIHAGNIE